MWSRWSILFLFSCSALGACGEAQVAPAAPRPALAKSRRAQAEFRELTRRWLQASGSARAELEAPLRQFIARYPDEDLTRPARIYLAWVLIQNRRLDEARALTDEARAGPAGSVRDFAVVTEAAIRIRAGEPDQALALLAPLQGKIIDPAERLVFGEQLLQAALGDRRWRRAIDYAVVWLSEAPPENLESVQMAVRHQLPRIPMPALERNLESLDQDADAPTSSSQRAEARAWLRRTLRAYLAQLALEQRDAKLARRLLQSGPSSLRRGKEGTELLRLAASGEVVARVVGRAVGLVLSLETAASRQRSAEVAMGMSRALGLPASAARPGAIRLLTRDGASESDGMAKALAGLAGDGAAILVAGLQEDRAREASEFAEMAAIPVVVLSVLPDPSPSGYTFSLGIDLEATQGRLFESIERSGSTARVGPGGEACDGQRPEAGRQQFPVREWKRRRVGSLLLGGDVACARTAVAEARAVGLRPRVTLGLGCSELLTALPQGWPAAALAVGDFPLSPSGQISASLGKWAEVTGGPPTWYHALGHDAALLVAAALAEFPLERTDDAREVARLHERAKSELARASAALWTSDRQGFEGSRVLARTPRVTQATLPR